MNMWNVRGWDNLAGANPGIVAAREELMRWLYQVPPGAERDSWRARLTSKLDHPHFSVRLELYLHHFFKERGWEVDIEPELAGANGRPDFRLRWGGYEILVEAKVVLDPILVQQQDLRLKSLADGLSKKLTRAVSIRPLRDLPPNLPYGRIASEIEKKANAVALVQEFKIKGEPQDPPYELEVTIVLEDKPTPHSGVGIAVGQAHDANTGQRMRRAIIDKSRKYGKPDMPLVIMVWPQASLYHSGPENDDLTALAGDIYWQEMLVRQSNGVFSQKNEDDSRRYSRVSAVGIYRFSWDWRDNPRHDLHVYHNPYADYPVSRSVFQGIPQGFFNMDMDKLAWLDNIPPRPANSIIYPRDGETYT